MPFLNRFPLAVGLVGTIVTLTFPVPVLAQSLTFTSPDIDGTISSGIPTTTQTFNLVVDNTTLEDRVITDVTLEIDSLTSVSPEPLIDLSSLQLALSSPGATEILIFKGFVTNLGSPSYSDVILTDAAATSITGAMAPITGSFRPEGVAGDGVTIAGTIDDFSGFNGGLLASGESTWVLTTFSSAPNASLPSFNNNFLFTDVRLNVTTEPVPESGTVAGTLLAVGVGLALFNIRRNKLTKGGSKASLEQDAIE